MPEKDTLIDLIAPWGKVTYSLAKAEKVFQLQAKHKLPEKEHHTFPEGSPYTFTDGTIQRRGDSKVKDANK